MMRVFGSRWTNTVRPSTHAPFVAIKLHLRQPQRPHATWRSPRSELLAPYTMNKHDVQTLAFAAVIIIMLMLLSLMLMLLSR
jgi:hypothetical protein